MSGVVDLVEQVRSVGGVPFVLEPFPTGVQVDTSVPGFSPVEGHPLDGIHLGGEVALPSELVWTEQRREHVINGDATGGWHSRGQGPDPAGRRIISVDWQIETGRLAGVYGATVEICEAGRCRQKPSTFFPDHWTESRVINSINEAYRRAMERGDVRVNGRTVSADDTGFPLVIVVAGDGRVISARPAVEER